MEDEGDKIATMSSAAPPYLPASSSLARVATPIPAAPYFSLAGEGNHRLEHGKPDLKAESRSRRRWFLGGAARGSART